MNRSAQVGDATQAYEALGGPGISNGCCLDCCGAPPGPINTAMIEQDGGKWVTLPDGRILEYFVYGSDSADAPVLVEISGSGGTAKYFTVGPRIDKMKELNVKGIGITVPGHGFSVSPYPNHLLLYFVTLHELMFVLTIICIIYPL